MVENNKLSLLLNLFSFKIQHVFQKGHEKLGVFL
jgi:hypothetical protein